MKSRFLNIRYVMNTLTLKRKALLLKLTRGPRPFDHFVDKITPQKATDFKLKFDKIYHSLNYLSSQQALNLHSGNRSITQDLIVGLTYTNEWFRKENKDQTKILKLAQNLFDKADLSDNGMIFYLDEPYARFNLKGRYFSGIVQGKAASFFLRCYVITQDENYKDWAKKCLIPGLISTEDNGVLRLLPSNLYWVEEYPSPSPSMVLNGHLFYLIGMAEYLTFDPNETLKNHLDKCMVSVLSWMPKYKLKNGLLYSMYHWSLCNVHYTGIMKYQFEHLYRLTDIPIFKEYADFTDALTDWDTFKQITY